jgi:hypothetical protein
LNDATGALGPLSNSLTGPTRDPTRSAGLPVTCDTAERNSKDTALRRQWLFTRPGFESEAGREWLDGVDVPGERGSFQPLENQGLVYCETAGEPPLLERLVFAHDAVFELGRIHPLPKRDRVGTWSRP